MFIINTLDDLKKFDVGSYYRIGTVEFKVERVSAILGTFHVCLYLDDSPVRAKFNYRDLFGLVVESI